MRSELQESAKLLMRLRAATTDIYRQNIINDIYLALEAVNDQLKLIVERAEFAAKVAAGKKQKRKRRV